MGNSFVGNREPVICRCNHSATYRCRYNGQTHGFGNVPGHPLLKPYWGGDSYGGPGNQHSNFIACDKCITDEVILYFTHIPNGWNENIKYSEQYEDIKLGWEKTKLP